jgi:hypothetical protein
VSTVMEVPRRFAESGGSSVVFPSTVRLTEDSQTWSLANWSGEGANGSGTRGPENLEELTPPNMISPGARSEYPISSY